MTWTQHPTKRRRTTASSSPISCSWSLCSLPLLLLLMATTRVRSDSHTLPIKGRIVFNAEEAPPTTKVVLNGGAYSTFTRSDGSFMFHDIPAGTYLLDVLSTKYYFSQVKISVRPDSPDSIICLEYKYPGAPKQKAVYPLVLVVHSQYQYFEKRDAWAGLRAQLSSPMTWMLIATTVCAFWFPSMLNSMDEGQKKQLEEQMKMSNPQALMEELLGGMGGSKGEEAARK